MHCFLFCSVYIHIKYKLHKVNALDALAQAKNKDARHFI